MAKVNAAWHSAKVVRTREKVSFFFGVMSLLATALLFGLAPQYVPLTYHKRGHSLKESFIYIAQVVTRLLYRPSALPAAITRVPIQETRMALFPLRPLLLRDYPQLHIPLDRAGEFDALDRVLLPLAWVSRKRGYNMAK